MYLLFLFIYCCYHTFLVNKDYQNRFYGGYWQDCKSQWHSDGLCRLCNAQGPGGKGPSQPSEGPTVESVLKSLIFRNWWIFLCKRRHTNEHFRIVRFGLSQTFVSTVIVWLNLKLAAWFVMLYVSVLNFVWFEIEGSPQPKLCKGPPETLLRHW